MFNNKVIIIIYYTYYYIFPGVQGWSFLNISVMLRTHPPF